MLIYIFISFLGGT